MKYLLLDTQNLLHRARSGFTKGDHYVAFNFFRGLRPLVEKFDPDVTIAVLEGTPVIRNALHEEYKGTRVSIDSLAEDDPQRKKLEDFYEQAGKTVELMKKLPIEIVRNPVFECDDVIANIAWHSAYKNNEVVIVSTDTDFIQLLGDDKISLYNPVKKKFVERPTYDYVVWKALVGDGSDNIRGIDGIGPKRAEEIARNFTKLNEYVDESQFSTVSRNIELISFHVFEEPDWGGIDTESYAEHSDMTGLCESFKSMGFKSMTSDKAWKKFNDTFSKLCDVKLGKEAV